MPFLNPRLVLLLVLSSTLVVSGCASNGPPLTAFPPVADLLVAPKPQLSTEAVEKEDAIALALHDSAIETWGDTNTARLARVCRWAAKMGMSGLSCPE